jgi:hypothetical protein
MTSKASECIVVEGKNKTPRMEIAIALIDLSLILRFACRHPSRRTTTVTTHSGRRWPTTLITVPVPGQILPLSPPLDGVNPLLLSRARSWLRRPPNQSPFMVLSRTLHHLLSPHWRMPGPWPLSSRRLPLVPLSQHSSRYWEHFAQNILLPPCRQRGTISSQRIAVTPRPR